MSMDLAGRLQRDPLKQVEVLQGARRLYDMSEIHSYSSPPSYHLDTIRNLTLVQTVLSVIP